MDRSAAIAAIRIAGIVLVASVVVGMACSPPADTTNVFCVFEGSVSRGQCPSLCSWQCGVANARDCTPDACVEQCILEHRDWAVACTEAAYDLWICMARSGRGPTTCESETVRFEAREGTCVSEQLLAADTCAEAEPLTLRPPESLCSWQCALAELTDCEHEDCVGLCESFHARLPEGSCLDDLETLWICMAEDGRGESSCGGEAIVFGRLEGTCERALSEAQASCADADPTRIPLSVRDGGLPEIGTAPRTADAGGS
jgi:hypothetical protein